MTLAEALRLDPKAEIGTVIALRQVRPTRWAASPRRPPNRSSFRKCAKPSAKPFIANIPTAWANWLTPRSSASKVWIWSSIWARPKPVCPSANSRALKAISVGDRVRCVIKIVDKSAKGPGVVVSRADAELVKRLFEQEVPEIYDGTVTIKGCAREAGERTKIAVSSRDRDVDSVGACVGMKGMRVQSIIRELRGEKIDIIEFSDDPVQFATHALSPAKISRVTIIDPVERHMEVIVDDSQLSLAIGKKGQNVRLAAKLLGWKIDIKSEEEKRQEVQNAIELLSTGAPVSALIDHGLAEATVDALVKGDIGTVEKLGSMTPEQLEALEGIDEDAVSLIQQAINSFYGQEYAEEAAAEERAGRSAAAEASAETGARKRPGTAPEGCRSITAEAEPGF